MPGDERDNQRAVAPGDVATGISSTGAPGRRTRTARLHRTSPNADGTEASTQPSAGAPATSAATDSLLRAEPRDAIFRRTRAGETSEPRRVTITNISEAPVSLVDTLIAGREGGAFTVLGIDSTLLGPGEATNLHLAFRPRNAETYTAACLVEAEEGYALTIRLLGHGLPSIETAIATHEPAPAPELRTNGTVDDLYAGLNPLTPAQELEAKQHGLAREEHKRGSDRGEIHVEPTYRSMWAAFELAVEYGAAGRYERALALAIQVDDTLRALTSKDRVEVEMRARGVGFLAPGSAVGTARDAAHGLVIRLRMRSTIEPSLYLAPFEVGRNVIELMTGETDDVGAFRAFDRASMYTAAASTAPIAIAAVIAGTVILPEMAIALAARALPVLAAEASLLAFATSNYWQQIMIWVRANPDKALAIFETTAPIAIDVAERGPEEFVEDLQTEEGMLAFLQQIFFGLLEMKAGGVFDDHTPGSSGGGGGRRGGGHGSGADEPGDGRVLPPRIQDAMDADEPALMARAKRGAQDAIDKGRAIITALKQHATGVDVPRMRSTAVMDGDEPAPLTGATDHEPVRDRGTNFSERYDHDLSTRRQRRAADRGELYEGGVAEGAITGRDLRRRGARVVARTDDVLMGDSLVTYQLPNKRQVTIREAEIAPPRTRPVRDPARARQLQAEAVEARAANDLRDAQAAEQILAKTVQNEHGLHVDRVFDRVITGGGAAAVELYASRPGGKPPIADGTIDLSAIAIADTPGGVTWTGRKAQTGQPGHETADVPLDHAPRDLMDEPSPYVPAQAFADAATITANNHGMPTWRNATVVRMDATPDATWLHPTAARRLWVRDGSGKEYAVYVNHVDLAGGLGPARSLDEPAFGSDPAQRAGRRAELEASGVLISAEAHLSAGTPSGAKKIIISGGGATAPWNAKLATQSSPDVEVVWLARGGSGKSNVPAVRDEQLSLEKRLAHAEAEKARLDREIQTRAAQVEEIETYRAIGTSDAEHLGEEKLRIEQEIAFLVQRRDDLAHGDAMLPRNLDPDDAFGMTNVRRAVGGIVSIEPVAVDGKPKAKVTLSDGAVDTYDQVIVNHGADQSVPGAPANLVKDEKLKVQPTGKRAHLASEDGAVRVFGAAAWMSQPKPKSAPQTPISDLSAGYPEPPYREAVGFEEQPAYSRGVPSFYLTGEQIREANK